jgi:hypothetical protein
LRWHLGIVAAYTAQIVVVQRACVRRYALLGSGCRAWRTVLQGVAIFEDTQGTAESVTIDLYNTELDLDRTIVQLGDVISSCASSNLGARALTEIDRSNIRLHALRSFQLQHDHASFVLRSRHGHDAENPFSCSKSTWVVVSCSLAGSFFSSPILSSSRLLCETCADATLLLLALRACSTT